MFATVFIWGCERFHIYNYTKEYYFLSEEALTQGDMSIFAVKEIIASLPRKNFDACIDLGSGNGLLLFTLNQFLNLPVKGIEISSKYYEISKRLFAVFKMNSDRICLGDMSGYMLNGRSLVFVAATCLSEETVQIVSKRCENLEKNAVVVSLSIPVQSHYFKLLSKQELPMTWGNCTVFIQERL